MRPIPELFGSVVGGCSHPEYAVWIRKDGFAVEKDGRAELAYLLLWKEKQKTWTCTCPSYIYRGWCKHPGIVMDVLQEAILEGRLK